MFNLRRTRRAVITLVVSAAVVAPANAAGAHNNDTTPRPWYLRTQDHLGTINGDGKATTYIGYQYAGYGWAFWTIQADRVADTAADGKCIELWVDFEAVNGAPHRNPSMFRRCSTGSYGFHGKTDTWYQPVGTVTGAEVSVCRVNYSGTLKTRTDCRSNRGTNWPQNVGAYQNVSDTSMSSQVFIHYLN